MPKLSIIIPTKNEEERLPSTFRSLDEQTFRDFEVIVADNESKDRTREIAKKLGARICEGGLPSVGRNQGAEHAYGNIFLFLDADTELPDETFLGDVLKEMDARGLDVAVPDVEPISESVIDRVLYKIYNAYVLLLEPVWPHAPGFCMFVTRRAHETIRGFDEDVEFAEDHDYAQRAKRAGLQYGILRKPSAVRTSVRRFHKDGRWLVAARYVWTEFRMMIKGPYKKPPFTYEMGGDEE